ncbi:hypothetical protein Tco_0511072 [Tanacetum coccineum]
MNSGSTSNSQFPGFSSQVMMTPEQQAFLQTQQQDFVEFQQNFQSQQQNPPQFPIPQQQSQSSNSLTQTESQPKRTRAKRAIKEGKGTEPKVSGVSFRWHPDKETLLAKCYVEVSEDKNVRKSQSGDTFWYRVLNEFNRRLPKSGENELDVMKWDRMTYRDENKIVEKAFEVEEEKDRTMMRLKEMKFLAIRTKDLPDDDAYFINEQKQAIQDKISVVPESKVKMRRSCDWSIGVTRLGMVVGDGVVVVATVVMWRRWRWTVDSERDYGMDSKLYDDDIK